MQHRDIIESIAAEYRRYKALAERAMSQLSDSQLGESGEGADNSVAVIAWHLAGNLRSRFTDFLTADGEKPWRDRETEFADRTVTQAELMSYWESGWTTLMMVLEDLTDAHLDQSVTIRGRPLTVLAALHRSLAHASYHVGQIVYVAKQICGDSWQYLSIPPGQSAAYNENPTREKPPD